MEKTGQGNRRGVSFHLILQILPERCRTSSDGKAGHGKGEKRSARTATTIMMLSLRGKSPSPERKVRRIPGVRLTRSCTVTTGKRLIKRGGFSSGTTQVAGETSRQFFMHYCVNWGKKRHDPVRDRSIPILRSLATRGRVESRREAMGIVDEIARASKIPRSSARKTMEL